MLWAVQSNFIANDQVVEITDALKKHNIPYLTVGTIPFTEELVIDDPTLLNPLAGRYIIPYGSTSLMKIAIKRQWKGLSFNDNFDTRIWNRHRADMLNYDAGTLTVKQAAAWAKQKDPTDYYFIRPVGDLKLFNGTLTTAAEIANWMDSKDSGNFSFGPDDIVSIAWPKNIQMEWRYFIIDRKIVSGSSYRARGQRCVKKELDRDVLQEAQKFASKWLPHKNCVMDLALVDNEIKVIEFNCINSSGFYDSDIEAIVTSLHDVNG